jgi:polyhydroxyalkanoate synthesis regulator phasin
MKKLLLYTLITAALCAGILPGCESNEQIQEAITELTKQSKDTHKIATKTNNSLQGQDNEIKNIQDNSKKIHQRMKDLTLTVQQENNKTAATTAEKIDDLNTKINNIQNSTALMITINAILAFIILILIGALFWIIRKLFSIKYTVQRVIQSPDNNLTDTIWQNHRKKPKK